MQGKNLLNLDRRPPKVMPATLRVEIRDYSKALFDAEAKTIIKYAGTEDILRAWLNKIAASIQSEVTDITTSRSDFHDVHCPLHDRLNTIAAAMSDRTEHWIANAKTDFDATMARGRFALERAVPLLLASFENPKPSLQSPRLTNVSPVPIVIHTDQNASLPPPPQSAKQIIDAYCTDHACSLEELADKAGIDRRQVFKIRNNKRVRNFAVIALAAILGVDTKCLKNN